VSHSRRPGVPSSRLCLVLCLAPMVANAQIRASERSTLTQTVDGTVISVDYARPRMRGRTTIYGTKAVHWDEVWTPGANWATTLEVSKPVEIGGKPLPKGKYSVWLVVRQRGDWTLVLDPDHHRYHMDPPDSLATQVRIPVKALTGPRTEVLTWSFPALSVGGGTLEMRWADRVVAVDFKVTPSYALTMAKEDAEALVGRWSFSWEPDSGQKADTVEMVLAYENGSLYGTFVPHDDYMGKFVMIRLGDGSLIPGLFEKGTLYEVIREEVYEFKGPRGRPDRFEVRDDTDKLMATGKRLTPTG
jgi:hypothetical protein